MANFGSRGGFGGEGYGIGPSLASFGADQKREAMQELGSAADIEAKRNLQNQQLDQQEKAGKKGLASTVGSLGVGVAGSLAASSASAAAIAGGATAVEAAAAGAQAGSFGGPMGMLIGGTIAALAVGLFD